MKPGTLLFTYLYIFIQRPNHDPISSHPNLVIPFLVSTKIESINQFNEINKNLIDFGIIQNLKKYHNDESSHLDTIDLVDRFNKYIIVIDSKYKYFSVSKLV